MGDPLLTPALVGAGVSLLLNEVIDAAKGAIRIKENCKILKAKVDGIVPLLEAVQATRKNSTNWHDAHSEWLSKFNAILEEAKSVVQQCIEESKCGKLMRLMKVWQWLKLPSRLNDINDQIDEARRNASLATLGVIQSLNSAPKVSKSEVGFVIQPTPPLIVGVDKPLQKLKDSILASHAKDKRSCLGLQGRGGAGKTLLAQQLNNDKDIQAKYGAHSILWITVGLDARVSVLYKTMGKFLNDGVFEEIYAHQNQEEQRTYLWNAFAKKKVLLILDDVWEKQRDYHEMIYWLDIATAPGSTTLITTRSSTVLSKFHAEVEVVLSLSDEDSWKLFCSHAFESGTPPSGISGDLAMEVCKECKGLPLALKVIGSAMLDKERVAEWRAALCELKQSKPISGSSVDDELYHRLQLSYNELKNDMTKTCFLYCAAFAEDYEIPVQKLFEIWIAEGLFGAIDDKDAEDIAMAHLEILVKRSMIDWYREDEYIMVHDILRDLAVYIIATAKPSECAYECFFQSGKVLKSFSTIKSLDKVKRMSFIQGSILEWPKSLQAPHLRVCLLSQISNHDKGLDIPEHFFLNMQGLLCLDLSQNHFCLEQKLPSFKGLAALKVLDLRYCESLNELPESIGELHSLTQLTLKGCKSLKVLPKSIGELKSLRLLDLFNCKSLNELPENIGELTSLIELFLWRCESLNELPESIGKLKCLTKLSLHWCKSLKVIPKSIWELKLLTLLGLLGCESLNESFDNIGELNSLTNLYIGCKFLKMLPKSIKELKSLIVLDLSTCESLNELPEGINKFHSLTRLYLEDCKSLKVLPNSIGELKSLTLLDLSRCKSLHKLPENISKLKSLTKLFLMGCSFLEVLPKSIGELESLTILKLDGCESLNELPESIRKLKSLTTLDLGYCKSLKVLPKSIGKIKSLKVLDLMECDSLNELPESIDELLLGGLILEDYIVKSAFTEHQGGEIQEHP